MKTAIYVGHMKESFAALKDGIMQILSLKDVGDLPKTEAMKTLAVLAEIKNISISNCHIDMGESVKRRTKRKP